MFRPRHLLYASQRTRGSGATEGPPAACPWTPFLSEVLLAEFLQDPWEGRHVNVRVERSAGLPLLTVELTIGKYVVFLTQLFAPRLDRQRSV